MRTINKTWNRFEGKTWKVPKDPTGQLTKATLNRKCLPITKGKFENLLILSSKLTLNRINQITCCTLLIVFWSSFNFFLPSLTIFLTGSRLVVPCTGSTALLELPRLVTWWPSNATISWWAITQLAQRSAEQEKQFATAGDEDLQPVQWGTPRSWAWSAGGDINIGPAWW